MKDYKFQVSKVRTKEGNEYPLLVAQVYPFAHVQIIPTTKRNQVERWRQAYLAGYVIRSASQGSYDFLALFVGVEKGKKEKVTQENCKRIAQSFKDCLQAGADFWNEYRRHHVTLASNCSLSYIE